MCRWIESIALQEGVLDNIAYHQARMKATLASNGGDIRLDLKEYLSRVNLPTSGVYKVRVVYELHSFIEVTWDSYHPKQWKSFELVEAPLLDYRFKFADRRDLDRFKVVGEEIIFTQQGLITDTTYSNLVFKQGEEWFTSDTCLLTGTQRQYLLDHKQIKEARITQGNLTSFTHFKLINAMMPLSIAPTYSVDLIRTSSRSFLSFRNGLVDRNKD